MPADLSLSERINSLCPCWTGIVRMCTEDCRCALARLNSRPRNQPDGCEWQGHALAGEVEQKSCKHGWRGYPPEDGQRIVTPCPACGGQLFIGSGGHLTCARLAERDGTGGCPEPSLERAIEKKIEALTAKVAAERVRVLEEVQQRFREAEHETTAQVVQKMLSEARAQQTTERMAQRAMERNQEEARAGAPETCRHGRQRVYNDPDGGSSWGCPDRECHFEQPPAAGFCPEPSCSGGHTASVGEVPCEPPAAGGVHPLSPTIDEGDPRHGGYGHICHEGCEVWAAGECDCGSRCNCHEKEEPR